VDVDTVGVYVVTYDVTDALSVVAPTRRRTINVVDTTPPQVTCPTGAALGDGTQHISVPPDQVSQGIDGVVDLATDTGLAASLIDLSIRALESAGFQRTDGSTLTDSIESSVGGGSLQPASFGVLNFTWNRASTATVASLAGTVRVTVTDASSNAASCDYPIYVVDVEPPAVTCPQLTGIRRAGADGVLNQYLHPSPSSGQSAALVLATDPGSSSAAVNRLSDLSFTFTDNSGLVGVVTTYTIDVGTIGTNGNIAFTGADQKANQATFPWNQSSALTTDPSGRDDDNDGLPDHDPASGGGVAGLSGVLKYVATDTTGNTGTCFTDVFVVDLEDPVVGCPRNAAVQLAHAGSEGTGFDNTYTHPQSAANFGSAYILQTDDGGTTVLVQNLPDLAAITDNAATGSRPYTVHRRDIVPTAQSTFGGNVRNSNSETFTWNPQSGNTTDNIGDVDQDGLSDTALLTGVAGQEAAVSSYLKFTVADQSGNVGSCVTQVVVVDLQDPVIACPQSVGLVQQNGADNRYEHPASATNVIIYQTGVGGPNTTGSATSTIPPQRTAFTDFSDNTAASQSGPGSVSYTVHRRDLFPTSGPFNGLNIASLSQMYLWNTASSLTTRALADTDGDGLPETGGAGNTAVKSSELLYIAHDQSGNQASCSMEVVVVDLIDPVVTGCPLRLDMINAGRSDLLTNDASRNAQGFAHTNVYSHPDRQASVYVYKTDAGTNQAATGTQPQAATEFTHFHDNSHPAGNGPFGGVVVGYTVHKRTVFPAPSTPSTAFGGDIRTAGSQIYLWNTGSARTTVTASDSDGDGLAETGPNGGQAAQPTAELRYVVQDQSGNKASCTATVLIVDLEDPLASCPGSIDLQINARLRTDISAFTGIDSERPTQNHINSYSHPTAAANRNGVFIFQTDDDASVATSLQSSTVPPVLVPGAGLGTFRDNTAQFASPTAYTVHKRRDDSLTAFDSDDVTGDPLTYNWNTSSVLTTVSAVDSDGDGLAETDSGGGREGAVSSALRYVVEDRSGNRASCTNEVVVVDLQDPTITCPPSLNHLELNNVGVSDPLNLVPDRAVSLSPYVNRYVHPNTEQNHGTGVFVYKTDPGAANASGIVATGRTVGTHFEDNTRLATDTQSTVVLTYSVHRKDVVPLVPSPTGYSSANVAASPETYLWNPLSERTTLSEPGDHDSDGLFDTGPGGGQAARRSSALKYTAHDQSGNRASCTIDVVVVDLEDPSSDCPDSIHVDDLANAEGDADQGRGTNVNRYVHPTTAHNHDHVFVYQTQSRLATVSSGTTPESMQRFVDFTDNCRPNEALFNSHDVFLDYTVHRTVNDFPPPGTAQVFNTATIRGQSQTYTWNSASSDTTVSQGDLNNDGVFDVDRVDHGSASAVVRTGGEEAVRSAILKYIVQDASGNRGFCHVDIVVVDLEDPFITCPDALTSTNMSQTDGTTNFYDHPANAFNKDYVLVFALDTGATVASVGQVDSQLPASIVDNTDDPVSNPQSTGLDYAVYRREFFPLASRTQFENALIDVPAQEVRFAQQQQYSWNWSVIGTTLQTPETGIRSSEAGAYGSTSFDATNVTTPVDSTGLLGDVEYGNIVIPDHYPGARSAQGAVTSELVYVTSDQSGNRASCRREIVVVDLEDPQVDCADVLGADYAPRLLFDGRTCIGANSTRDPPQICIPRDLNDLFRDPRDTTENEHIVDAIHLSLPTRSDNTDGYIDPQHVGADVRQTLNAGGSGGGASDNGEYAVNGITATYGGYVPHYFGITGLDRHPLREAPVITFLQPTTRAQNAFNVHFDLFDRSGNRKECDIATDSVPIEVEVRCSPIYNWRFITDCARPGPENESHPCECCARLNAGELAPLQVCPPGFTCDDTHACAPLCESELYRNSTGCGGGWPETVAGEDARTMCYPRVNGTLLISGTQTRECLPSGKWSTSAANMSQCGAASAGGLQQFEVAQLQPSDPLSAGALTGAVNDARRLRRQRRQVGTLTCQSTFVEIVAACPEGVDTQILITDQCLRDKILAAAATWLTVVSDAEVFLSCTAVPSTVPCFFREHFNAGFGDCTTYATGQSNAGYCNDIDSDGGPNGNLGSFLAKESCNECAQCVDPPPPPTAPTAAPTEGTAEPTPAPRPAAPTFVGVSTAGTGVDVGLNVQQGGNDATAQDTLDSTTATSLLTGSPTPSPAPGRRRRSLGETVRSRRRRDAFDVATSNPNACVTADEARLVAERAARLHAASGQGLVSASGAVVSVPCRAKVGPNGFASEVDDNGNPTENAERCTADDPDDFCVDIPGCAEDRDAGVALRIDHSFAFPLACPDKLWEGHAAPLYEEYIVSPGTKKSGPVTAVRLIADIVNLLNNASVGAEPRVPLLSEHCPTIASALVRGEDGVQAEDGAVPGEGCGRRIIRTSGTPKTPATYEEIYVCDYVDLVAGCDGPYANPRQPEIQQSCFEVCAALAPTFCTAYAVDLNPVNLSDPDTGTRELFGRCLLFNRPLQDFSDYDFTSTPAPTPKKGSSSPKTPKNAPDPVLQFHHECHFTSSIIDVELLPDYANDEEFCTDPIVILDVDVGTPKSKKSVVPFDFTCNDVVVPPPTPSPTGTPKNTPKETTKKKKNKKSTADGSASGASVSSTVTITAVAAAVVIFAALLFVAERRIGVSKAVRRRSSLFVERIRRRSSLTLEEDAKKEDANIYVNEMFNPSAPGAHFYPEKSPDSVVHQTW